MEDPPRLESHYGSMVWTNPTTETIRKKECLCHNCDNLKPDQPDNCSKAEALFQIIKRENVALIITRCPAWKPKKEATCVG
ncbi:MAG: hypothetical protein G01um101413_331 [Parcubacteria group bacterium Gr01-1014_13]|nr:MAG: hypothetical protein G01um101413_331 [Parcubacteria group bacterium Gr01-1014_13]